MKIREQQTDKDGKRNRINKSVKNSNIKSNENEGD